MIWRAPSSYWTLGRLWELLPWPYALFKLSQRYVLYVALHEVYNFYIRDSIEVYIIYVESDPDPHLIISFV